MTKAKKPPPLPTREQLLTFIRESKSAVGKREITRAFGLTANDRKTITTMLKSLEAEGVIGRGRNRRYLVAEGMPSVTVIEVTGLDPDGEPIVQPVEARLAKLNPKIRLISGKGKGSDPAIGERLLVRLSERGNGYTARIMRRVGSRPAQIQGIFRKHPEGGRIEPADRRRKGEFLVASENVNGAENGEFVICDTLEGRVFGLPTAKVTRRIGPSTDARVISELVLAANDIPIDFPDEALKIAESAKPTPLGDRTDLRNVALVTIDDEDARDFDDAVWAEPDSDPRNEGGWRLMVAIADVGWYVRPGDALDECARLRGNSVYLPDRVVPMLPEALSNGLCSLVPGEERPCMAVEITIDKAGNKRSHKFMRGLMRSAARLTYRQVQAARDGYGAIDGLMDSHNRLNALYGAFASLLSAREARGTLDLDLPERRIRLADDGRIAEIKKRERLDSHRLIEEFMILANVCAAETLQECGQPCMYRIHDDPAADRVSALRDFLKTMGLSIGGGQAVRPVHFAQLLRKARGRVEFDGIQDAILRTQSQAVYSPENLGHFGLALRDYAHFTSPIRRYSDLLVHRALIRGLKLGPGGLEKGSGEKFDEIGAHISMTERRAMTAERDAFDRLAANFLSDKTGAMFEARITGVESFGLFVELDETGANALLPLSTLGNERFELDEKARAMVGQRSGKRYTLGTKVTVDLLEVVPETGSISVAIHGNARRGNGRKTPRKPFKGHRKRKSKVQRKK